MTKHTIKDHQVACKNILIYFAVLHYLKVCLLMFSHGHLFLFISLIFLCKPLFFFYQINIVKQQLDLYKLTSMELNLNDYLIKSTLTFFFCLTE